MATKTVTALSAEPRPQQEAQLVFGLIGKMWTQPGKRGEVLEMLDACVQGEPMPGCYLYLTGGDPAEPDVIVVAEVWQDEQAHKASLELRGVRTAIQRAMPLLDLARMERTQFEVATCTDLTAAPARA